MIRLLDMQPSQKKAVETTPTAAKKTIGCQVPCKTLKAAKRTTMNQLFANFMMRRRGAPCADPDVLPTASEASTPMNAATYSHSSLAAIIDTMSVSATANGVHGISRSAPERVCSVPGMRVHHPSDE
jgi:hypothetical protein